MTDDMLGPSPMHIKYSSYVYNTIYMTNFPGPIESVISKFTCIFIFSLGWLMGLVCEYRVILRSADLYDAAPTVP